MKCYFSYIRIISFPYFFSFLFIFSDIFLYQFILYSLFYLFLLPKNSCKDSVLVFAAFLLFFQNIIFLLFCHFRNDNDFVGIFSIFHAVQDFSITIVLSRLNFGCIIHSYNKKEKN